ncbi:Vacuolar protein-sorting-associated protein [Drechslerella dactyloides]|uniref:Vacuolar protein sorting-associated protein 27 n=1 Tax=Drechslerella dactyloides TaxID=74499 RepID=A0AAD6NFI6_DREDA|nr:Vacuolar protein-sorting-associated protein [Drechslerella dactyloides]
MAGWFGSGTTAFDEQIEKATSSALEDMAANLEICDIIRSKQVAPKEAMRSLKRRIGNKNPNIQLAALQLTDACVKNGGSHFLQEIASREFIDNLVSLMNAPQQPMNLEVKFKMLELIQAWAIAFEGQPQLTHVGETYRLLKHEGYQFPPPPSQISKAFVDSSAPPEWADSDVCLGCRNAFTMMNRKHHCRNCGNVFCGTCSSKTLPLLHIGIPQAVRVCDGCYNKLTQRHQAPKLVAAPVNSRTFAPPNYMQPRNARIQEDSGFDADLRMALKMSEEEARGGKGTSGYVSQNQLKAMNESSKPDAKPSAPQPKQPTEEDEDEELKAAIAASLADMEEQKKKSAWNNPIAAASAQPAAASAAIRPDYELTPSEAENINLFSTLVHKLQGQPPGTILREPAIQELYESVGKLRPKLARTFGETMSKYEALCDLHAKLATVVRYYDKMLEDRLSYTYSRHGLGTTSYSARPSYANIPQNAESFYGAQYATPPPQSEASYSRPQSTYQVMPGQRQSQYQQTPQAHYAQPAQPTPAAAQESQKYNMYPTMPSQPPQQVPGAYPQVSSPTLAQQAAGYPPLHPGLVNNQAAPTPQSQPDRQGPPQTPQSEYPPSAYPSMPSNMPSQPPRSEYSASTPHPQLSQQPTGHSESQPKSPPSYPPQEQYAHQYPPQQQASYPPQDPNQQAQQGQPYGWPYSPHLQQQQPHSQSQPQSQMQIPPQTPHEAVSSPASYPPQSTNPPTPWQAQALSPQHQPDPQPQPQPQVQAHPQPQDQVPTDFYRSYPVQVQQQQQPTQQHAAYYQQPAQKPIIQQSQQPAVEESLIDL